MSMSSDSWLPTASHALRQARAQLLRTIRNFFFDRQVLEVDTPLLSHATVTDLYLDAFSAQFDFSDTGKPVSLYLQTSPEYAMKRLLCAQSGPIYQICKAFRHEGAGRWHNPEFTMLEWYRPGFTHHDLMAEVDALLQTSLNCGVAEKMTYAQAFARYLSVNPLEATTAELQQMLTLRNVDVSNTHLLSRDDCLQLLFSYFIEPHIGMLQPCFVYGFPASQAALARINQQDPRTADRFEVYFKGIELANGFYELQDAAEQRQRFLTDNKARRHAGKPERPVDENLLDALASGLPDCAGVALGIDRLLMLATGAEHINDTLNFPVSRA